LPRIDAVLISHSHYDHLDLPTLRDLHGRSEPLFVTGLGNGGLLASRGMARSTELDWWQKTTLADGAAIVTFVPACHWSNRGDGRHNTTLWGGFVIEGGGRSAYFAGDSGWFSGFATIRERCGAPDIALLPIGAYEPRWFHSAMHMNPEEAVRAHLAIGARQSLGCHFGVWQLTDEAIDAPIHALAAAREKCGVSAGAFRTPAFGETVFAG
jgi:L-ascorbate metabolism protein UlaG (beta-lactamase superfamily)